MSTIRPDSAPPGRLPEWLRQTPKAHEAVHLVKARLRKGRLHTVCEEARCPNLARCFALPTATFLLLGDVCTRGCRFCNIRQGAVLPPDPDEPKNVADAARQMELAYVVLTSVTRDDLADGGAGHFAATVRAVRGVLPGAGVEVLVPDFRGRTEYVRAVIASGPDVFNHNVETVPRLYAEVRPGADFDRSLDVLRAAKALATPGAGLMTKSGLMVGLGETDNEVIDVMRGLRGAGCDILTVGQYLRPRRESAPVREYVHPDRFRWYEDEGRRLGFAQVFAGPLVRSSFSAAEVVERARIESAKGAR